ISRFPDPALWTAAVHAALGPPPLISCRVEDLMIGRIHHQIIPAGVIVDLQYLLPRSAAIAGLVDTSLAARTPEATRNRDKDDILVPRIDGDAADVAGGAEAHVCITLSAVHRFVDAVAPRCALAIVRLACADPHKVRVALRDGEIADRHQPLILHL